jgi:hypothetical protein
MIDYWRSGWGWTVICITDWRVPWLQRREPGHPVYSIFDSGVYRIQTAKWLFPQEKATFDALVMSTSEAKML